VDDDDRAEVLDEDTLGDLEYPPEEPLAVDDPLTPAEEQVGESIADRARREARGVGDRRGDDRVGPLVAPGDGDVDDEAEEIAIELRDDDETLYDVVQEREGELSAEEAAMHLTDPPPLHDDDGYVED
jgi:hypothetical protein